MDTSPSRYGTFTPDLDVEAWSSDVASSPTRVPTKPSKFAFDLNSVRFQTSQSLPIIHTAKCPCARQCKHACCVSAANAHVPSVERSLLSPVHGRRHLNSSGFYGSMDRTGALTPDNIRVMHPVFLWSVAIILHILYTGSLYILLWFHLQMCLTVCHTPIHRSTRVNNPL